jgi:hypothetical protein
MDVIVILTLVAINVATCVIAFKKGRTALALVGICLFAPCGWYGAARLAEPGSWWYERFYGFAKRKRSWERVYTTPFQGAP